MSIQILDDDCLDIIFSFFSTVDHLTELSLVCKRWNHLCMYRVSRLSQLDTRKLVREDVKNKRLHVSIVLRVLSMNFGNLSHLHINRNVLYQVANRGNDLCTNASSVIESEVLLRISEHCPNLKTLSLTIAMNNSTVKLLLPESFPIRLKSLSLNCGNHLESESKLIKLLEKAKSIQMLNLGTLTKDTKFSDIFRAIQYHDIKDLYFQQCTFLTNTDFSVLLDTLSPSLQTLSFTNPFQVNELITNLPYQFNPEKCFPQLKNFQSAQTYFRYGSKISHQCGLFNSELLTLMPYLEVLDLSSNRHQSGLTRAVVQNCPLLKRLHLSGCELTFRQLMPLKKLQYLEHLDLSWTLNTFYRDNWLKVVNEVFVKIISLKYIDLRGATISNEALIKLIFGTEFLEVIDISECQTLSMDMFEGKFEYICYEKRSPINIINKPLRTYKLHTKRVIGPSIVRRNFFWLPAWLKLNEYNVSSFKEEGFWEKALKQD